MNDKYHQVIGIDLGTTYSAVAVYNKYEEQTEIIRNPEGDNETTPSVISLDPMSKKAIVGWAAKRNLVDTLNTIIEIKREMGEDFRPETLQKYNARGQCKDGDPVKVPFNGDWYLPQEISAFTLMRMKEIAEGYLGGPIHDAVITVPAYFTVKQKKATEEAALLAGLYPRQLIPEPTSAAICYGVDRMEATRKTYLVYDLGGGTFDVSIISVEESLIDVLATSGDPRLGGGDFDDKIVAWALEELKTRFQLDIASDREKCARLKAHAEQLKKDLSSFTTASMNLIDIHPQRPPVLEMTREQLEELLEPLLNKSLSFVEIALKAAEEKKGLRREEVDAILLVGGSTKIPRVKAMLLDYFQQDENFVSTGLNPDEVVARGAATVALKFAPSAGDFDITKRPDRGLVNTELDDQVPDIGFITEHSLGLGVQENRFSKIVDQGTNIPASKRQGGFTNGGVTDFIEVPVYQGEGEFTYENSLIGTLKIGPMEPKQANFHQFEVTFALDDNGLLSMTVHHINEGKNYQGTFQQKTGVGGPEALKAKRAKLVKIYGSHPEKMTTLQKTTSPPVQPVAPTAAPQRPAAAPPKAPIAPAAPPVKPQPLAANPGAPAVPPADAQLPAAGKQQALQPAGDVPDDFKSIVRRVQKRLAAGGLPKLLASFNRFVTLLNAGAGEEELTEAGDELEDVYHDSR